MKVGVNILNFGPGVGPEALLGWARTAETLGFHGVFISDHVAVTPAVAKHYPEPFFDPFTALAWLAGQTTHVSLGTTVAVLPHRHPALTARLVANIDNLSGGRFIFGAGVGVFEDEFAALGLPFRQRGRLSDETLEAILALWTGEGPVTYRGEHFAFEDVLPVMCAQRPHPPVWVGGSTEGALKRTVRFGAAWHPILDSLDAFAAAIERLRVLAHVAGLPLPPLCPRIRLDIRPAPLAGARAPGVGSIDQVHSDLADLQRLGAEYVVLDWYNGDLEATRDHNHGWEMLAALADSALNLRDGVVR